MPDLQPAIFLDRDGVIIENRADYVKSLAEAKFIPGALEALARLPALGRPVVMVTNQAAIGRRIITRETVNTVNEYILAQVAAAGGRVDAVYLCPHRPDEGCPCRKPAPGLLLQAAADLGLDLSRSVMVGDAASDVQAAVAAGVQPIFVLSGLVERQAQELAQAQHFHAAVYADLAAAVEHLLNSSGAAEHVPGEAEQPAGR